MKERLNIALAIGDIRDDYSNLFSKGAMQAASDLGCNITIVSGRYYHLTKRGNGYNYEYQYQTLFNYISSKSVDGAILCSDVIGLTINSGKRSDVSYFIDRLKGIPFISVSKEIPNVPVIKYDNTKGFYKGISYMIEKDGLNSIAMVAGPRDNMDSTERVNAYKSALKDHNIAIKDELIIYGDFTSRITGPFEKFLTSHPEIEGVAFANDKMAIACYDVAIKCGRKIGRDIFYLGFDDEEICLGQNPTLSTVSADIETLGYKSVVKILRMINENDTSNEIIPSNFVLRESLLRTGQVIVEKSVIDKKFKTTSFANKYFSIICSETASEKNRKSLLEKYKKLIKSIKEYSENQDVCDDKNTLIQFNNFLGADSEGNINLLRLAQSFDELKKCLLLTGEVLAENRLSDLFVELFEKIIREQGARNSQNEYFIKHYQHSLYNFSSEMFEFSSGKDDEFINIASKFSYMGIKHCYMYLFKKPIISNSDDLEVKFPDELYLKAYGKTDDLKRLPISRQKVKTYDIFRKAYEDNPSVKHWVTVNLFFGQALYGVILCDIPYNFFRFYEVIIYQTSSACRMISLLKDYDETRQKLEDSLKVIQENYAVLENLSKVDPLTNLFNRRGFVAGFDELLAKKDKYTYLVCAYVDLDNLKIINDNYGHDEGDFSIKSCGNILNNMVSSYESILARIGGDEFAFILLTDDKNIEKILRKKKDNAVYRLNKNSNKTYKIDMSMGIEISLCDSNVVLSDILDEADNKLYRIKKQKHSK